MFGFQPQTLTLLSQEQLAKATPLGDIEIDVTRFSWPCKVPEIHKYYIIIEEVGEPGYNGNLFTNCFDSQFKA